MKNHVFRTLLITLFVVFFSTLILSINFFEVDYEKEYIQIIALCGLFIALIPLLSNYLAHLLIESSLKPVSSFLDYITQILMNDNYDESKVNIELEEEVLDYLVKYGHNSKDVKEALDRVKHAQALRKEFSANVTHELKSPLTSINGYAEMIESGMTTYDQAKDFAKIIHEQGNRLLTMIDETIKLSKFDNNYVKTERFSLFNLNDMIEQNIKSLTKFAHGKNVTLEYEPNDTLFYGNDKLMDDLIRNMISNGIKYSKEDGGMVKIILKENLDEIILKFIDQGIGIAEENQERIFERFYVINKSRDRKTGTGLGLSLVKNIALMHKGKVEVLSKLDRGSEFIITFPKLMENDYKWFSNC